MSRNHRSLKICAFPKCFPDWDQLQIEALLGVFHSGQNSPFLGVLVEFGFLVVNYSDFRERKNSCVFHKFKEPLLEFF